MDDEQFDWDAGNIDHLSDIEPEEAEEAILDPGRVGCDVYNMPGERRWGLLGRTDAGDILFVVYTYRNGKVRVVTARLAVPREQRRYRTRGK